MSEILSGCAVRAQLQRATALMFERYVSFGATISACGKYRARLWREWRGGDSSKWHWWRDENGKPVLDGAGQPIGEPKSCVFVMLNPSRADGHRDDQTIGKCVTFARRWGFDRLDVLNLFSYRATDPRAMLALTSASDPVGPDNAEAFSATLRRRETVGMVVCAWGAHGRHLGQDETALGWIEASGDHDIRALGLTKAGCPRHPLYLPLSTAPVPFGERLAA